MLGAVTAGNGAGVLRPMLGTVCGGNASGALGPMLGTVAGSAPGGVLRPMLGTVSGGGGPIWARADPAVHRTETRETKTIDATRRMSKPLDANRRDCQ
jgi:hypothetical protein